MTNLVKFVDWNTSQFVTPDRPAKRPGQTVIPGDTIIVNADLIAKIVPSGASPKGCRVYFKRDEAVEPLHVLGDIDEVLKDIEKGTR